nr:MAG TPA: hypothetical protein [Caudoviricetes sp.]
MRKRRIILSFSFFIPLDIDLRRKEVNFICMTIHSI